MKRANRGFTLLEVMLVGVLTVSVLGMGLKLYVSAQRMSAYSRLAQERIAVSRSLDKDLRAIMRQATGITSEAGGLPLGGGYADTGTGTGGGDVAPCGDLARARG